MTTSGQQPAVTNENPETESKITPRIIVQGGAHYVYLKQNERGGPPDTTYDHLLGIVGFSAKDGYDCLMKGGSAVDAVEKAVRVLESSKYFNAGRGSLPNARGEIECDAMIMDGSTLDTGAVIAAKNFLNPVSIARKIMDHTPHCALTGEGALEFARGKDYVWCEPEELRLAQAGNGVEWADDDDTQGKFKHFVQNYFTGGDRPTARENIDENQENDVANNAADTVSAVALDQSGCLACATSTGGLPWKKRGRVGDAPLVGCGGYANEFGAAATLGHGEAMMKFTLSRQVVFNMEGGQTAQEAAENGVRKMAERLEEGYGCAIAIDSKGNFGKATNYPVMLWASFKDGELDTAILRKRYIDRN